MAGLPSASLNHPGKTSTNATRVRSRHGRGRMRSSPRRGGIVTWLVVGCLVIAVLGVGLSYFWRSQGSNIENQPLVTPVVRGPFEHIVLENGEVESFSNVEVKCEVKANNSAGTVILDLVPEGTLVKEGDWLVSLDSSKLETDLKAQRIAVNASRALYIRAKAMLDQAVIAKDEYISGTYLQEERQIESEILIAEEKLSRAVEAAKFAQRLAAQGFQSELQLKADMFAVDQAQAELDLAKGRLKTLQDHTRKKMLVGFDSEIEAAQAAFESEEGSYTEEMSKLKELEDQIAKCTIRAPLDGQVVYANVYSSRGNAEFVVEPGSSVRENQTIIRLPDPTKMQIKATINESRITSIEEGMKVDISINAFDQEQTLTGEVTKVNKYAEPSSWFSSQVKTYATLIRVLDPPPELRTGMTAEVQIYVDQQDEALQVPVQSVYVRDSDVYCLVQNGSRFVTRQVEMGTTNDKMVTILSGLEEGEQVVLGIRQHEDLLDLPKSSTSDQDKSEATAVRKSSPPQAADPA